MKRVMLTLIVFIMPLFVYADEIALSCPSEVDINSEFVCDITGKTNDVVTAVSTKVNSENFTFISFDSASSWIGDGLNGEIELYTAEDMIGTFDIGTVKFKSNDISSNVVLESVVFYDIDGKPVKVDMIKSNVNIKNNKVNNNISDNNSSNTATDNNNNNNVSNNVSENKNNVDSKVDNIIDNSNDMNFSEDGIKKDYDIRIKNYDLNFKSDVYEYSLKIKNEDELDIVFYPESCEDCLAFIRNNKDLANGSIIEIEIMLNDNVNNNVIYTINIIKDDNNYTLVFVSIILLLIVINIVRVILSLRKNKC